MKLESKVALITGATAGMGKEISKLFAKEGAKVVLVARREERLKKLVDDIESDGGEATYVVGDVTNQENVDESVKTAVDTYGKLDILVNNAGTLDGFESVEHVSTEMWDKVFDINLKGQMRFSRAAIPEILKNGGGSIVNIASVCGQCGKLGGAAYTASKYGIIGLTKNIAWTYAKKNIRCNAIAPGSVKTELGSSISYDTMNQEDYDIYTKFGELNPVFGKPEEIAKIALFLASNDSSLVNGTVVTADGGWTA